MVLALHNSTTISYKPSVPSETKLHLQNLSVDIKNELKIHM